MLVSCYQPRGRQHGYFRFPCVPHDRQSSKTEFDPNIFLVLPVNFSTRINAYTMPTRSNCHTTEISTNNPVHSSSQSSDPEIHERSPNARIHIRDGDAVQKISTSAPMMGVTNDNGIDAVRAESGLIDSPTAEVAIGSVIGRSSMTAILDRMEATKFQVSLLCVCIGDWGFFFFGGGGGGLGSFFMTPGKGLWRSIHFDLLTFVLFSFMFGRHW
ncbi:hypothetical protein D915_009876 [Fasciola hepatica]|uniref:Uncharacterized protein n=1 Tax=Fasciola hepatica TaxID=6192 RepID=A0A4E0QYP4_FASHE|nr:hypothetical protein D915_009876 [Fasciola hepatica]